jgi:hypothetical protein
MNSVIIALMLLLAFLRLYTGMSLFRSAHTNNLPNLYWLSMHFLLNVIVLVFAPAASNPLANTSASFWIMGIGSLLFQLPLILFNQSTFYVNRKSPADWFLGLWVLCTIPGLYAMSTSSNMAQSPWHAITSISICAIWIWHTLAAYQSWQIIKDQPYVEDWIKTRYKLIIASGIILALGTVGSMIRVGFAGGSTTTALGAAAGIFTVLTNIIAVPLQFLIWVLPENFRRWLNRNYREPVEPKAA